MLEFTGASKTSIGLDIGTDSIKYVKLKKKGRSYNLLSYDIISILHSKDKPIEQETSEISKILKNILKDEKIKTPIITSISGSEVIIKSFNLAHLSKNSFSKSVYWASKKYISIPVDNTYFDYKVIGEVEERNTKKKKVMFVAATKKCIYDRLELFNKAGLKIGRITVVPFAFWNLMKFMKPEPLSYALLDIGETFTTIAIFQKDTLTFTREIITSGNSITESVCYSGSLAYEDAEKLKKESGLLEGKNKKEVSDAIKAVVERLINEIKRTFSYYMQKSTEYSIDKVYLTGGTSMMPGLLGLLKERMEMDVEVINPFENIELSSSLKDLDKIGGMAPLFSHAVGLALDTGEGIDLLPPEIKQKKVMARIAPVLVLSAFSLLLILFILFFDINNQYKNSLRLYNFWKTNIENLNQSLIGTSEDKSKIDQLAKIKQTVEKLEKRQMIDLSVLKEISNILPETIILESLSIDYSKRANINRSHGAERSMGESESLDKSINPEKMPFKLQGIIHGNEIDLEVNLLKFLTLLNGSPFFKNPTISYQERIILNEKMVLRFKVSSDLE